MLVLRVRQIEAVSLGIVVFTDNTILVRTVGTSCAAAVQCATGLACSVAGAAHAHTGVISTCEPFRHG